MRNYTLKIEGSPDGEENVKIVELKLNCSHLGSLLPEMNIFDYIERGFLFYSWMEQYAVFEHFFGG